MQQYSKAILNATSAFHLSLCLLFIRHFLLLLFLTQPFLSIFAAIFLFLHPFLETRFSNKFPVNSLFIFSLSFVYPCIPFLPQVLNHFKSSPLFFLLLLETTFWTKTEFLLHSSYFYLKYFFWWSFIQLKIVCVLQRFQFRNKMNMEVNSHFSYCKSEVIK